MNKQLKFYVLLVTFVFLLIGVVLAAPETTPAVPPTAEANANQAAIPDKPDDPNIF